MIRLLTKADAKQYWELRLQALQVNPEAFVTTYEEAVRQENPLERVASNLSSNSSFTFGAFNNENRLVGVVTLLTEEKDAYKHKGHSIFSIHEYASVWRRPILECQYFWCS